MRNLTVLVVDDDVRVRNLLRMTLETEGHRVTQAADGQAAMDQMRKTLPDVIILDLVMQGMSGLEVCEWVRESWEIPIIVLSAHDDEELKVKALDLGADDYVIKPFENDEFLARIRAVVRRSMKASEQESTLKIDGLTIDVQGKRAFVNGSDMRLTRTEFALLTTLARSQDAVLSHDDLLARVWGNEFRGANHYLHVYLGRIRKKMGEPLGTLLETVPGMGYMLHSKLPTPSA